MTRIRPPSDPMHPSAFYIPFSIPETAGLQRSHELILGGIPLPQGVCRSNPFTGIIKDSAGCCFPVSGQPAAFWPDGSVKWLHLWGRANLQPNHNNPFTLHPATPSATPVSPPVPFEINPTLKLTHDNHCYLREPGLSANLQFTNPDDTCRRTFTWTPGAPETIVQTPDRTLTRWPGTFLDGQKNVSELILFMDHIAGAPELRIQAVFIYLGIPEQDLIRSLTLKFHTLLGGMNTTFAMGTEQGRGYSDGVRSIVDGGPSWSQARLLQSGSSFFKIEKRISSTDPWVEAAQGQHTSGWAHMTSAQGGLTLALRSFWQEYPHELLLDALTGEMTIALWPASAEPLDLRRYSKTVYGKPVYESAHVAFEHIALRQNGPDWNPAFGATGIAKSCEMLVHLHPPTAREIPMKHANGYPGTARIVPLESGVAETALRFAQPCRIMPEPASFAACDVVGKVAPPPPGSPLQTWCNTFCDFLVKEREVRGWYGQMHYGDLMLSFISPLDRWAFDTGGYAWLNTEVLPDYGLWLHALLAGNPVWLEAAIAMTRHNRDVDMYHRGLFRGYGTRHNVNHWGCTCKEWRISMPWVKRLHYYLTADPWTEEVIRNTFTAYAGRPHTGRLGPDTVSAFAACFVQWEMSGSPQDRAVLETFMDSVAASFREDGRHAFAMKLDLTTGRGEPGQETHDAPDFFLSMFGGQHALVEAAECFGHQALSEAIIRYTRWQLRSQRDALNDLQVFLAFAWRRTLDPQFSNALRQTLSSQDQNQENGKAPLVLENTGGNGPLDEPRHFIIPGLMGTNKTTCYIGRIMHQIPYGLHTHDHRTQKERNNHDSVGYRG